MLLLLSLKSNGCGPSAFLKILVLVKDLLELLKFLVPMLLIVMLSLDFFKAVIAGREDDMKKNLNIAIKRLLFAAFIFLVPEVVNISMSLLGDAGVNFAVCYDELDRNEIAALEGEEKAEFAALYDYSDVETPNFSKNAELIISDSNVGSTGSSASGCDGLTYYEGGVFYIPLDSEYNGHDKSKGSAEYGYNKYFFELIKKMTDDAKAAGYGVNYSNTSYGAWRSYEKQEYFWGCYQDKDCNGGNLAAYPGTSRHGWGIASDLNYVDTGTHSRLEAITWAHEHAGDYGLNFPVTSENWHIEPSKLEYNDDKVKKCF